MDEPITDVTIPEAGRLRGVSAVHAWRMARSGRWGEIIPGPPDKVPIAAIERESARTFTASQIKAVVNKRLRCPRDVDPRILAAIVLRDASWRKWLADEEARLASPEGPPPHEFIETLRKIGKRRK
jgi:hypothetical protein